MGLNAEVQGQSVAVDGMRIGLFDEAGNFLTPVQMDGMDYVPLAPFCNALGIQIEEENGGFAITRKTAEQRVAETKAQTGKIALTPYNFGTYFSYSLQATNVSMTPMRISSDGIYQGSYEADYVLTCEARSVFEIENVSFQLVGKPQGLDIEDIVILADMPASGSLTQTVHESGTLMLSSPKKEDASVDYTVVNHVSGCLIVDKEKADAANLILAGKSEGQWTNEKGCTVVSDYVYNEYGDEVFRKSTYRSPNNRVYQDGASFIEFHEYTYDEHENTLKETIGKTDERTYEYIYDDYGRVKIKTQYQNYKVLNKTEYSYGENGLLRQTRCFNSSNELTQTNTYTYAYYGTERVHTEKGLAEHRERMNQLIEEAQKEPEKTYTTLKPGNDSQEVLDARMKLYELGYFKKKPTQTKYTDSMADYVKKFEKDHGLTQDGVLSPEDQEVLFGE